MGALAVPRTVPAPAHAPSTSAAPRPDKSAGKLPRTLQPKPGRTRRARVDVHRSISRATQGAANRAADVSRAREGKGFSFDVLQLRDRFTDLTVFKRARSFPERIGGGFDRLSLFTRLQSLGHVVKLLALVIRHLLQLAADFLGLRLERFEFGLDFLDGLALADVHDTALPIKSDFAGATRINPSSARTCH